MFFLLRIVTNSVRDIMNLLSIVILCSESEDLRLVYDGSIEIECMSALEAQETMPSQHAWWQCRETW